MRKYKSIIILFIAGLLILLYPYVAQYIHSVLQGNKVTQFQKNLVDLSEAEIDTFIEKAQICNEEVYYDADGFRDPFGDNQEKLTTFNECIEKNVTVTSHTNVSIEGNMFGAIEIPKLKLVIPIYLGSSETILSKGVGHVEGSSLPLGGDSTHTVLAGHRGMWTKAMFRNIDELHDGDVFYIHTMNETLRYQVFQQKVIYPNQTGDLEIQENKDLATLLTCHPYGYNYQRLLVQAERKK